MTALDEQLVPPRELPTAGIGPVPQVLHEDVSRMPAPELPELPNRDSDLAGTNNDVAQNEPSDDPFKLSPDFAYKPRKIKVFTIGAGFSGLLMAHKFQHRFPEMRDIVEHTIFEARSDVGGTWLANHYPGVQCDVPAHIYVSIGAPVILIHMGFRDKAHKSIGVSI